jgi:Mg-chelatase subunit ChlD
VEFSSRARVLQTLTNNYSLCRRAVDSLTARGGTKMFDGLMTALNELLQNGGLLKLCGITMTPRVILMTDGKPTDAAGEDEVCLLLEK